MALLSEYGFNEGSGLVSADSSGNGRDLDAFHTTNSWDAGGHTGAGARFEHSGNPGPNTSLNAYTIMCWAKRTSTWSGWAAAFGNDVTDMFIEFLDTDSYAVNWFGGITSITSTTLMTLNTWVHIACTRRSDGICRLIINGTEEDTGSSANAMNFGTDNWFAAGGAYSISGGEDTEFLGIVDDLRIFDTDLDEATITTWMNTPISDDTGLAWIKA